MAHPLLGGLAVGYASLPLHPGRLHALWHERNPISASRTRLYQMCK